MQSLPGIRFRAPLAGEPKYIWINRTLTKYIKENLQPGDAVPSERNLAETFKVSRMTARRVLSDLVDNNLIIRKIGHGNVVAPRGIELNIQGSSFTEDMKKRGVKPSSKILEFSSIYPDDFVIKNLEIPSKIKIYRIIRLRLANDEPVAIEQVNLDSRATPELEKYNLEENSLYDIFKNQYRLNFESGVQKIKAKNISRKESRILQIAPGSAALHLKRITVWNSQKIECTISIYRADRYELTTNL